MGDVIEKAMRRSGLTVHELSERAGVPATAIDDAINYRSELGLPELRRLSAVLELNEVGVCALASGHYPLPALSSLPFCVYPLSMVHGIGVANAYLVCECGASRGVLFDAGPAIDALRVGWPRSVKHLDAVFVTHVEAEHVGGLCEAVKEFGPTFAYCPEGAEVPCASPMREGSKAIFPGLTVTAFHTPGHAGSHNCYLVEGRASRQSTALLVSGDLFFAGSVGAAHFCQRQLATHLKRMLQGVPPQTIIAPGHGPMTTAENELRYNPFVT